MEVSLSSDFNTWKPGDSGWLLVEINVAPKWHMYWKNASPVIPLRLIGLVMELILVLFSFPNPENKFLEMVIYVHEASFVLLTKISLDEDYELEKSFDQGNL